MSHTTRQPAATEARRQSRVAVPVALFDDTASYFEHLHAVTVGALDPPPFALLDGVASRRLLGWLSHQGVEVVGAETPPQAVNFLHWREHHERSGIVVTLEKDPVSPAGVYLARLLQRELVCVADLDDLRNTATTESVTVVASWEHLDASALIRLPDDRPVGLLAAPSIETLSALLMRALVVPSLTEHRLASADPTHPGKTKGCRLRGRDATAAALARAVGGGVDIVVVDGESWPCAGVLQDSVICGRNACDDSLSPCDPRFAAPPPCIWHGQCDPALGEVCALNEIPCSVLFILGCSTFHLAGSRYPLSTLLPAAMTEGLASALVGSLDFVRHEFAHELFVGLLQSGFSLGEAVLEVNRCLTQRDKADHFYLLGDAGTVLYPHAAPTVVPVRNDDEVVVEPGASVVRLKTGDSEQPTAFLPDRPGIHLLDTGRGDILLVRPDCADEQVLLQRLDQAPLHALAEAMAPALWEFEALELIGVASPAPVRRLRRLMNETERRWADDQYGMGAASQWLEDRGVLLEAIDELDRQVADELLRRGSATDYFYYWLLDDYWDSSLVTSVDREVCPVCGQPCARSFHLQLRLAPRFRRVFVVCPICNPVVERPQDPVLAVSAAGRWHFARGEPYSQSLTIENLSSSPVSAWYGSCSSYCYQRVDGAPGNPARNLALEPGERVTLEMEDRVPSEAPVEQIIFYALHVVAMGQVTTVIRAPSWA